MSQDRKKLAQLSRRLKTAQARYGSLERRSGLIEERRIEAETRASRIYDVLFGPIGKRATAKRRLSLATSFKKAKDAVQRLSNLQAKIDRQLREQEEKVSTLKDNMKRAGTKKRNSVMTPAQRQALPDKQRTQVSNLVTRAKLRKDSVETVMNADKSVTVYVNGQERARLSKTGKAMNPTRKRKTRKRNASATKTLKKAGKALKKAVKSTLDAGSGLLKAGSKALNPTRRIKVRNSYIDLVIKGTAKKTPQGWKIGKKTVPQGKGTARLSSGYYLDKATGAVYAKRQWANPTRKGMRKLYREAKRISKITRGRYFSSESGQRKAARHEKRHARKSKRNPSPQTIRKKFAGRLGPGRDLYFPKGAPQGLAKLGKLVSIKVKGLRRPITPTRRNPSGDVWLCSDTNGRFWLGSTVKAPLVGGSAQRLGEVSQIEYEESKPHLGYGKTVWFHHMGEEGGRKPVLYVDDNGDLIFKGGSYKIKKEGITN